jgi:hypothetical protein
MPSSFIRASEYENVAPHIAPMAPVASPVAAIMKAAGSTLRRHGRQLAPKSRRARRRPKEAHFEFQQWVESGYSIKPPE